MILAETPRSALCTAKVEWYNITNCYVDRIVARMEDDLSPASTFQFLLNKAGTGGMLSIEELNRMKDCVGVLYNSGVIDYEHALGGLRTYAVLTAKFWSKIDPEESYRLSQLADGLEQMANGGIPVDSCA